MDHAVVAKPQIEKGLEQFLTELSALTKKYNIGIGGRPELYTMEPEDSWHDYVCDRGGQLVLD